MSAPWSENANKVVVEFLKTSQRGKRMIRLSHRPDAVPPQLYGRVPQQLWINFMNDVLATAEHHPYTANANAGYCCQNLGGFLCGAIIGFGFFKPDPGDYQAWTAQVVSVIQRYQPEFGQAGCNLSLQTVHGSFWIQIDIDNTKFMPNQGPAPGYAMPAQQAYYGGQGPSSAYPASPGPQQQPPPPGPPGGYDPAGKPGMYPPYATNPSLPPH